MQDVHFIQPPDVECQCGFFMWGTPVSDPRPFRLVVNKTAQIPDVSGVYLITDQVDGLVDRVGQALRGGVSVLQYRAKELAYDERLAMGGELKRLCSRFGTTFIINDDVTLARELDADGVHLGQDDGRIADARALLGAGKIIGKSTHNLEEALLAEQEGADYIGFGAMYPTGSKVVAHLPGVEGLEAVRGRI